MRKIKAKKGSKRISTIRRVCKVKKEKINIGNKYKHRTVRQKLKNKSMIDKINKGINTIHKKELENMKQIQKERPEQIYIKKHNENSWN